MTLYLNKDRSTISLGYLDLTGEAPLWAGFDWGEGYWGIAGAISHKKSLPQTATADRMAVKLYDESQEPPFEVEMLGIGVNSKGVRPV